MAEDTSAEIQKYFLGPSTSSTFTSILFSNLKNYRMVLSNAKVDRALERITYTELVDMMRKWNTYTNNWSSLADYNAWSKLNRILKAMAADGYPKFDIDVQLDRWAVHGKTFSSPIPLTLHSHDFRDDEISCGRKSVGTHRRRCSTGRES